MPKYSNIAVKVEGFTSGDPLDTITDMIGLSEWIGCCVSADLNGVYVLVNGDDNPTKVHRAWMRALKLGCSAAIVREEEV